MTPLAHDPIICAWCRRLVAEEFCERSYPVTFEGIGMAARYHPAVGVASYIERPFLEAMRECGAGAPDPDADRETLWGEPA
jgi:hypothetical protein